VTVDRGAEAFARFAASCRHRRQLATPRGMNALNIEASTPAARCILRPPRHWPPGMVLRWVGSGGDLLVFGQCARDCALGHRWCESCGHRADSHIDGVCRVQAARDRFPCGCEATRP
jgi:hypothetical protein